MWAPCRFDQRQRSPEFYSFEAPSGVCFEASSRNFRVQGLGVLGLFEISRVELLVHFVVAPSALRCTR